jgi:hypothetical protein
MAAVLYRFQLVTALLPRRLAAVADRRYSAKANWKRYYWKCPVFFLDKFMCVTKMSIPALKSSNAGMLIFRVIRVVK